MSLPSYPNYRDSGDEWLGAVPAHWEVTRLKRACDVFPSNVDKKTVDGQAEVRLCNYTDVYYNDVIRADLPFMEASATDEQIKRFELRAGDTIFTKDSETPDDIARSAYVPYDLPGVVCGYHLSMARPRKGVCGAFIKRYFDGSSTRAYFHVKANGLTRVGLGQYAVDNAPIALPPLSEQTAIAAFLDCETAKIDALVEEQRRLIELLKEKRQVVISHAVTKGLDPTVPMKDSGVEWLGEVPAHWERKRLRHIVECCDGQRIPSNAEQRAARPGQIPYWGANTIMDYVDEPLFDEELVLLGEDGAPFFDKLRPVAFYSRGPIWPNNHVHVLRPREPLSSEFLAHVLNITEYAHFIDGSTRDKLTKGAMMDIPVPWPPAAEREAVSTFLARECSRASDAIGEIKRAQALLQEHRAALISAAVTGEIDVRDRQDTVEAQAA